MVSCSFTLRTSFSVSKRYEHIVFERNRISQIEATFHVGLDGMNFYVVDRCGHCTLTHSRS